jgi:hypothetical protein
MFAGLFVCVSEGWAIVGTSVVSITNGQGKGYRPGRSVFWAISAYGQMVVRMPLDIPSEKVYTLRTKPGFINKTRLLPTLNRCRSKPLGFLDCRHSLQDLQIVALSL